MSVDSGEKEKLIRVMNIFGLSSSLKSDFGKLCDLDFREFVGLLDLVIF